MSEANILSLHHYIAVNSIWAVPMMCSLSSFYFSWKHLAWLIISFFFKFIFHATSGRLHTLGFPLCTNCSSVFIIVFSSSCLPVSVLMILNADFKPLSVFYDILGNLISPNIFIWGNVDVTGFFKNIILKYKRQTESILMFLNILYLLKYHILFNLFSQNARITFTNVYLISV